MPPGPTAYPMIAIMPGANECKNLLVPACLSSSHIAYGSIRIEPVFMILAGSVATAASLAIDQNIAEHQVSYSELGTLLLEQKQCLEVKAPFIGHRFGWLCPELDNCAIYFYSHPHQL
ncbi:FAD-dependent oxidoreductase [Pedobacter sp. 22226]|uniref:FAD-dependent oxidoreductase n=1 Tax=Pedobacter sp. 22226 TaxID=3453894 RepID=UPI003F834C63